MPADFSDYIVLAQPSYSRALLHRIAFPVYLAACRPARLHQRPFPHHGKAFRAPGHRGEPVR
jgi:hypothetical protein